MSRDTRLGRSMIGAARRGSAMRAVVVGLLSSLVVASPAMAVDITVTTTVDESLTDPDNGNCTLREAIEAVRTETQVDACSAGVSGLDRILLTGLAGVIGLREQLVLHNGTYEIIGPGARQLTISAQDQAGVRVFEVRQPANGSPRTISGLTIAGGRRDDGSGLLNRGNLIIKDATIRDNRATDDGGGMDNSGTLRVENSTFTGNRADHEGGGVVNFNNATFVNTTFSGNQAGVNPPAASTTEDGGGAIFNSGGTVTLINCTIAGNTNVGGTQMGDGIFMEDDIDNDPSDGTDPPRFAVSTLQNTLVAANDDDNCMSTGLNPIADGGGNLDDGTTCGLTFGISMPNGIAGLDPAGLQPNNSPTTDTIALTLDSDAIDLGFNNVCADPLTVNNLDQRGATRPIDGDGINGAACDTGAFERGAVPPQANQPPAVTNPGNQTGVVGANVNLAISASDPDGNTLSYSATGLPAGLSINAVTGVVTGTLSAAGTSNVTVTVSDGLGGTTPVSFIWTVTSSGPTTGPAPQCSGRTANVFVRDGFIVGGPDDGLFYNGRLRGTPGRDVLVGTAVRDILVGSGGNDWICGGGGNDNIKGGAGKDRLFGQAGKDKLAGGSGSDRCDGGPGRDTITTCERILKR